MEDHWTKKRGFVNPATSEISRSLVSGMSLSDSQRRILGGLPYLKTYHTTGDGNEIIAKSFDNSLSVDIKENNIVSKNINLKSEYIITYLEFETGNFRISVRDPETLQETHHICKNQTDFSSSPSIDSEIHLDYAGYDSMSNTVWDHKRGCFVTGIFWIHYPSYSSMATLWAEVISIAEDGEIIDKNEIFSKKIPYGGVQGPSYRMYIGNSLAIVNSTLKEKMWCIYYFSGEFFPHLSIVNNGIASNPVAAPKCDGVTTNGSYLIVPGDDHDDYKYPYESNFWYWNKKTEVGKGQIYTALLEGDQEIKLYSKNNELIRTINAISPDYEYTWDDHRINYMIGTSMFAVDFRDFNPYAYGGDRCKFVSFDGKTVRSITDYPGNSSSYTDAWANNRMLGVGERVTVFSF